MNNRVYDSITEGSLTQKQRDALLMADSEKERKRIRKGIREHGEFYDPNGDGGAGWWPNKYPDM